MTTRSHYPREVPAGISERQVAHFVLWFACLLSAGCGQQAPAVPPVIEFRVVPEAGAGGPERMATITGTVRGARAGQRIVLFAKSGQWWVQPFAQSPYTPILAGGGFESATHLGTEYAALLVDAAYVPPRVVERLPAEGAGVAAVASVAGKAGAPVPPSYLQFSGYDWEVVVGQPGRPTVWTDADGHLHLQVSKEGKDWTRAEVAARRSLGYGTYSFTIRDMPVLEPATALRMFTWDQDEAGQNHREMDIELSRWGDGTIKNAQFVVQPYYVAANAFRFEAPGGSMRHSFRWEAGRVRFQTAQLRPERTVAEHLFTSGVPTPGLETVHLSLQVYGKSRVAQEKGVEVVIESFEFLP